MTGSSSYQLNGGEIQYLSLLLDIVNSQNWNAFEYAILNNPDVFQSFARTISQSLELNGMTILHACVRFSPPSHIVKNLLELVPESPSCVDCLQRTPLHIAAGTRARLSTIQLLSEAYPGACAIQDEDGKTPLHLACDSSSKLFQGDLGSTRESPSYEVVKALIQASPLSVPLEDDDGMSALEHAIISDAPINVVNLLQSATRTQCKAQQNKDNSMGRSKRISQDSQYLPSITMSILEHGSVSSTIVIPARKGESPLRKRSIQRDGNLLHV